MMWCSTGVFFCGSRVDRSNRDWYSCSRAVIDWHDVDGCGWIIFIVACDDECGCKGICSWVSGSMMLFCDGLMMSEYLVRKSSPKMLCVTSATTNAWVNCLRSPKSNVRCLKPSAWIGSPVAVDSKMPGFSVPVGVKWRLEMTETWAPVSMM